MRKVTGVESNIWKYGLFLITSRRAFWPILTVYFLFFPDNTLRQIGIFMAVAQVVGLLLEVPSGYIADKIGHKQALIITKLGLIGSTLAYLIGGNVWVFALGAALHSGAMAFQSGTLEAFMQETLVSLGKQDQYSEVIGKIKSVSLIVTAVLLSVVPALVGLDMRLPFVAALVLDLTGLVVVFSLVVPKRVSVEIEEANLRNFWQVLKEARKLNFIPVIIFSSLLTGILMAAGLYRDVYQQFLGIPLVYLGVLLALSRLVAAAVSRYIHKLKKIFDINGFFLLQILFFMTLVLLLGFVQNKWFVAFIFIVIIGTLWGKGPLTTHYKLEYINQSRHKATLLSLGGLLKIMFFGAAGFVLGILIENRLYQTGYLLYGAGSLVLILAAYLNFLRSRRKVV